MIAPDDMLGPQPGPVDGHVPRTFVDAKGYTWTCFVVEFDTADGLAATALWGMSPEHALERLDEMKRTARIVGIVGTPAS